MNGTVQIHFFWKEWLYMYVLKKSLIPFNINKSSCEMNYEQMNEL